MEKRRKSRCGQFSSLAAALHLTLLCLSYENSFAFQSISSNIPCSKSFQPIILYEVLPWLPHADQKWVAGNSPILSLRKSIRSNCRLSMSTKDDGIRAEPLNSIGTASTNATSTNSEASNSLGTRSSVSRTLLLAIPLMMKFALVLLIKFLTDLVVFPILLTYRAARLSKRRLVRIWTQWTSRSIASSKSGNVTDVKIEVYKPNGAVP